MRRYRYILILALTAFLSLAFAGGREVSAADTGYEACCIEANSLEDGLLRNHLIHKEYYSDALSTSNLACSGQARPGTATAKPITGLGRAEAKFRAMSQLLSSIYRIEVTRRTRTTDCMLGLSSISTSGYVTYALGRIII